MKRLKAIILLAFFGLAICPLYAATEGPGLDVKPERVVRPDVLFERFTSNRNGLPDNRIRSVFQDSNGFLWVGTMNGLSKYDGYTFKKYFKSKKANSISGNWVNAICEDRSHNLWIGTLEGLNYFDTRQEKFTHFSALINNKDAGLYQEVRSLLLDKTGKLWIGTKKGLASYDPATQQFKAYQQAPFNTNISKIIQSADGFIWIAAAEGLIRYNPRNDQYDYHFLNLKPNAYGERLWSLLEHNQDLFIATAANGLLKYHRKPGDNRLGTFEPVNLFNNRTIDLSNTQIFDICRSSTHTIWLATARGLAKVEEFDTASPKLTFYKNNPTNSHSLSENMVFKVFADKTHVLWCGTEMGLNKLDLNTLPFHYFSFTNYQDQDQIRSIYTEDGSSIYFGTAKSGFYAYDVNTNSSKSFKFQPEHSLLNANRSVLVDGRFTWIGTLGGVVKLTDKAEILQDVKGLAVFAFLKDSQANLWMGTNGGLFKCQPDGSVVRYLPDGKPGSIPSKFIRSLYEDSRGLLWIGFDDNGLHYLDPKTGLISSLTGQKTKLIGNTILSITEYPENTIWVGSESGLHKIALQQNQGGELIHSTKTYFEEDGLPDKCVNGIIVDEDGFLWISTIKGLLRFDAQKEQFQHFLTNLSFSASCYHKLPNNHLLFGAADGFILFDPKTISNRTDAPDVVLTDLKLFNKDVAISAEFNGDVILNQSITNTNAITLGYKNNVFTFGFAGLHYSGPENNHYAYKMEGFDQDWVYTGAANRSATYTNLNPGTYLFKVKAANSFGNWNAKPRSIQVTILPPPWKTWWAITAYVLLFNLLLFLFIRYIIVQSKQKEKLRFHQLEREQLENLNKMKLSFFTDISHEFRTPLSLIVGPVEDLLTSGQTSSSVKQKLQLVYRNCKKMLSLVDELMTFQKLDQGKLKLSFADINAVPFIEEITANFNGLAGHKKIDFQVHTESDNYPVAVDTGKMEMVMNNLLSNAFKFTPVGGTIRVVMDTVSELTGTVPNKNGDNGWLRIVINDNGKGINQREIEHIFERFFQADPAKTGSGVGLSLSKNIVDLHDGTITVESEPDVSTTFTIYLPLTEGDQRAEKPVNQSGGESQFVTEAPKKSDLLVTVPLMNKMLDEDENDRPTLLLVDDNYEVLEFLDLLFRDDYQTLKAENGEEALAIIRKREPDLIISDVMMPGMDGIELCRIVKGQVSTLHIPVILLTARSTVEDAIRGIEWGADDYVPKPFRPDYLRIRVEKLIEKQRKLLEKLRSNAILMPDDLSHNPLDDVFLQKVIDCIRQNMSNEEFSVEELGTQVGMSRSNLFRRLKAITGQTPVEIICYIRLKHSMELLLGRKLNVSEIAYEVGFKSSSSFSKSFKKQFGKSPSDYLNDILNNKLN
ncbi:hybrid sensor histidine kinase/response regulator transcription factor [Larkinella terrae]|uniref:histidine kinase n=1 Tax=Larkinella terrae TaxID=2025311 RepID=A0A7K0EFS0_9BACT|nr:hybrid sensor histidine kinase/response regulator transcription factor [Larkinella terrae]MRS60411.1 response regulator [Larkinella terrae]